jgi:hypothetical protein
VPKLEDETDEEYQIRFEKEAWSWTVPRPGLGEELDRLAKPENKKKDK